MFKKTSGYWVKVGYALIIAVMVWPLAGLAGSISVPNTYPIDPEPRGSGSSGNSGGSSYDYGAAQRAQEQAEAARRAEAERQAELERQRRAADERRRQEEAERKAEFIRQRDSTVLRGSTGTRITPNTGGTGLRGLRTGSDTPKLRGSGTAAGSQLKSAEKHSRAAAALRNEQSSDEAKKGFDTAGKFSGSLVYPDKNSGGRSTFGSSLPPEAKKDPQIQQSLAWHRKNESLKADTAKKIATIKEQQKKGEGDPVVLAAKIETLKNQESQYAKDQAKAKQEIKARVKDLGLNWDEK